jgi:signal transduction histidine kinase
VDVDLLVRGMLDTYPEFHSSRAAIEIAGKLPLVLANEAGLVQCFSNLIGNAVKFVAPGVTPSVHIWSEAIESSGLSRSASAACARLWIEDNGIGIPRTMLPKLFTMFSRGTAEYEGTGIGLALVRKVVDRMGGRVGVESELGKGSRFWITLPLAQQADHGWPSLELPSLNSRSEVYSLLPSRATAARSLP